MVFKNIWIPDQRFQKRRGKGDATSDKTPPKISFSAKALQKKKNSILKELKKEGEEKWFFRCEGTFSKIFLSFSSMTTLFF